MQHRQCEGSDRNLCLCKMSLPLVDSRAAAAEEPHGNSERFPF